MFCHSTTGNNVELGMTPEEVVKVEKSCTGKFLKEELKAASA